MEEKDGGLIVGARLYTAEVVLPARGIGNHGVSLAESEKADSMSPKI